MPKTNILGSIGSWTSHTFRGDSSRSKTLVGISTGVKKDSNSLRLDGSSERGLAWAEVETPHGDAFEDGRRSEEKIGIPMRPIKVQQTVDVV
jgi:hypothetical protein